MVDGNHEQISSHLGSWRNGKGGASGPGEPVWFPGEDDPKISVTGGQAGE